MQAPFSAPTFTSVSLPGTIQGYQTEAIVFDAASRAYVATTGGIAVLDPPYTSVAFTMAGQAESIAITPSGNQILATHLFSPGTTVSIFTAPFSSGSTPVTLTVPGAVSMDGITVTPDGTRALVADFAGAGQIVVISAPFNASSATQIIPLGSTVGALEDISVSADGNFALATGGSNNPAALIRAPFTTAGATVCQVPFGSGGRGAGAVRFLPVALQPPIGPPPATLPVPTLSQWALLGLGVLLSFAAFRTMRRRYH
jgi:DNA-binding beta-propeller fold protein YncE